VTAQGLGGFVSSTLVTLRADTGMLERRPAAGSLQSVRGTTYASVERELTEIGEFTTVAVGPVEGGGWGGLTFEANGGVGSLGEDRLYISVAGAVHAYDITTACLPQSPDGSPLICNAEWVRPVNGTPTPVVIGDDTVYTAAGNTFYAHRARSGGFRWGPSSASSTGRRRWPTGCSSSPRPTAA
jgi:hypothetical protein